MIKNAITEPQKFEEIISQDSFLAKKIRCEYEGVRDKPPNNFYILNHCAFMLMGENMTLCGTLSPEDIEQLSSFCSFFGVYTVESHGDIPLRGERREVCLLERREEECTEIEQVTCNKNIYEFAKFCCGNFDDIEFETVYSYFAGKVNKGQSNIYYTTENGKIITGAIATFYAYDTVYITFVSTDKAHRGQGRARGLISHIAGLNRGKKIQLMCEEELKPFYLKLGFAQIENLTLYNLRNERI